MCNLSTGVYNKGYDSGISADKMEQARETAYRLKNKGMSIDEIADMIRVGVSTIQEWLAEREEMLVK